MTPKHVRQRGVLHLIAVIPLSLSLLLLDSRLWGIALGIAILVGAARYHRLNIISLILAALCAYAAGYRIEFLTNPDGGVFYLQHWSGLMTLAWIIAVSQGVSVVGQLDPSGRLLIKILIISSGALTLIALLQGQWLGMMLLGVLFVIVLGLRTHAVPPKWWSHAAGYGLAVAAIVGLVKTPASVALLMPLIALVLPFTSTLSIAYTHKLSGSWLDELPIGRTRALIVMYLLSAYMSVLAFLVTRTDLAVFAGVIAGTGVIIGLGWWSLRRLPHTEVNAKKFVLFGTSINCVTLDEAVQRLESFLSTRASALVCTPDTTAILQAQRDQRLRTIYERADLVTPDGTGIVWAGRLLGAPVRERVSGIDLLEKLFSRGRKLKLFLLGAAPGVAEQAAQKLCERYPHLQVVGTHHGYFRLDENKHILRLINQAQPDILLVGLGMPKQELWMYENRAKLNVSVLMGVGGCFDVWAGRLKRAPTRWQRLGLEWLYRVFQEPRRLARVRAIPVFVGQISLMKLTRTLIE